MFGLIQDISFLVKYFPLRICPEIFFLYESSVHFLESSFSCINVIDKRNPLPTRRSVTGFQVNAPLLLLFDKEKMIFHRNIVLLHPVIQLYLRPTFKNSLKLWKMYMYLTKRDPNQLNESHPSCRLGYRNLKDWKT